MMMPVKLHLILSADCWILRDDLAEIALYDFSLRMIVHFKLYVATTTHNFKWVKITHVCLTL